MQATVLGIYCTRANKWGTFYQKIIVLTVKFVQSDLKAMVGELIHEVKYQISAGLGGP